MFMETRMICIKLQRLETTIRLSDLNHVQFRKSLKQISTFFQQFCGTFAGEVIKAFVYL